MDMPAAIQQVLDRRDLDPTQMTETMQLIMTGQATASQIGGFLIGLRMKGETSAEIAAAAQVMRQLSSKVNVDKTHLVDTCGTGGDSSGTFNVSTATAFVVAAAGGRVAKHGNRSVSSKSGSADVLEAAGVNLNLTPEQVAECINEIGIGFLFAQNHHSAMKHAIMPRKEMAVRTLFNLLGPLTNPANAPFQVLGVFNKTWLRPIAEVLNILGSQHVMVVHAADGLDEISISGVTHIAELKDHRIEQYDITPEQFGIEINTIDTLKVTNASESLTMIRSVFDNESSPARDIVRLNAGAGIYAANLTNSLAEGVKRATEVIQSGAAKQRLQQLIEFNQ